MEIHITCLFPELLAMIFGYLDVRDKGAQLSPGGSGHSPGADPELAQPQLRDPGYGQH